MPDQNNQASIQAVPTVTLRRIPRCPVCFERDGRITPMVANGEPLASCLICGSPAPPHTDEQVVEAIPTQPRWRLTRAWLDMLKWELFRRKMT